MLMIAMCHEYAPGTVQVAFMLSVQIRDIGPVIDGHGVESVHVDINVYRSVSWTLEDDVDFLVECLGHAPDRERDSSGQIGGRAVCDPDPDVGGRARGHHVRGDAAFDAADVERAVAVFLAPGQGEGFRVEEGVQRPQQPRHGAVAEPGVSTVTGNPVRGQAEHQEAFVAGDKFGFGRFAEDDGAPGVN